MPPPSVPQPLPGVKRILGVASGKGGVGKSTVAFHLALAATQMGKRVGLLDADIHGPSLPFLLGRNEKPDSPDGKTFSPIHAHNLVAMSMGFLVPEGKAAIWRGPMMHHALDQLIFRVNWGELDLLIIDFPPGTGDIPLSLAQKLLFEVVLVSTSQLLALQDVRRGIEMFRKVGVPLLGLIENMATIRCAQCHHETHLWGEERVAAEAISQNLPFLGALPLDPRYQRVWPEGKETPADYLKLAEKLLS